MQPIERLDAPRRALACDELERFVVALQSDDERVPMLAFRISGPDGDFRLSTFDSRRGFAGAVDTWRETSADIAALCALTFADTIVLTARGPRDSTVLFWTVHQGQGQGIEVPITNGDDLDMANAANYECKGGLVDIDTALRQFLSQSRIDLPAGADFNRLRLHFHVEVLRPCRVVEERPS